jgi:hypothetical protein
LIRDLPTRHAMQAMKEVEAEIMDLLPEFQDMLLNLK